MVSGAAALLLQQRPTLTPDQVKKLLTQHRRRRCPAPTRSPQGAGQLNIKAAVSGGHPDRRPPRPSPVRWAPARWRGARGTAHVADPDTGVELTGERDIMGQAWNPATWRPLGTAGTAWTGGTWNGSAWTGAAWTGTSWATQDLDAAPPGPARTWSGSTWTGRTWSAAGWTGAAWSARTWSGRTWSARTWSGGYWASRTWQ